MNVPAIFHQPSGTFCYQLDNDTLEISILTAKDVTKVQLIWADPYFKAIWGGSSSQWKGQKVNMVECKELENHYRWTAQVVPPAKRAKYYFKIFSGDQSINYMETGFLTDEEYKNHRQHHTYFIYPWMNPADTNCTPKWAENAVFYQIFPSRFARGKTDFMGPDLLPWPEKSQPVSWKDVYGGNLTGITEKLDYLQDLGITGIYMTPINQSYSQHKYDTVDYTKIDPSFGTNEDLKKLVKTAHKKGIRIVLDGVFNHSGWFFFAWQDVLNKGEKSKYKDWYFIKDYDITVDKDNPWKMRNALNGKYYSFAYADGMPKLNTNNPEVQQYFLDVCKMWVKEYDIDGIRVDVGNEISHQLIQLIRTEMCRLKPDFYFIGEIWHNAESFLRGTEYHTVMNYPLQISIIEFLKDKSVDSKKFEININRCYSMYQKQINRVLFNQVDTHDTMRMVNRLDNSPEKAKQAVTLLFSMPGTACIYYGTEILLEGGDDPDNRRCMPWKAIQNGDYNCELEFFKKLIELRKTQPALLSHNMNFSHIPDNPRILKITKTSDDGSEILDIYINGSQEQCKISTGTVLISSGLKGKILAPDGLAIVKKNRKK